MKLRYAWIAIPVAALMVWGWAQLPQTPATLASNMPPGAVLYLEAKDFAALLNDWNKSPEKPAWLASANYDMFSKSRLFLRLSDAQTEFAEAAGVPPDMAMLSSVAGSESALAIYDIGKLEFLYMTRLPAATAAQSVFRSALAKWSPRSADGISYSVKIDKATKRVTAYSASNGMLLLATREDLMAGALALLAKRPNAALRNEAWFDHAVRGAGPSGELRLACNLESLTKSPHFRSYWIQQNITELKQYEVSVADLTRSGTEVREKRVLIRAAASAEVADASGPIAQLLRMVPANAGLQRAWGSPQTALAEQLVTAKILAPHAGGSPAGKFAPPDAGASAPEGSEDDLETKIDETPYSAADAAFHAEALRTLLQTVELEAALSVQSTKPQADGVFIGSEAAVALLAKTAWNGDAARAAVLASVDGLWTSGKLGLNWVAKQSSAGRTYYTISGLSPVVMALDGRTLLLATSEALLLSMLQPANTAAPALESKTVFTAQFRHGVERANFGRLMKLIEHSSPGAEGPANGREPEFFSENLLSLSMSLARVESESIAVRDLGNAVTQTVVYRLRQ